MVAGRWHQASAQCRARVQRDQYGSPGQRSAALLAFFLAFGKRSDSILDQPEDDLDNHLINDLVARQLQKNKRRRQVIVVTHNANVVINGDAELVNVLHAPNTQPEVKESGALDEKKVQDEVCTVMEGGRDALDCRYRRLHGANGDV